MGRFVSKSSGVTFTVSDDKDERYAGDGYEPAKEQAKAPAKKAASSKPSSASK